MKTKILLFAISILCSLTSIKAVETNGVDIAFTVNNYNNAPVVLGYYFNGQMLVKDTVVTNETGFARLQKDEKYAEGIYVVYFPDKGYFDIMLTDDQSFTLQCDTLPKMVERVKVSGSKGLENFISYQNYLNEKQALYKELSEKFKTTTNETDKQKIKDLFNKTNEEVKAYNDVVIEQNRDNFLSVFLTALKEIEIPDFAKQLGLQPSDSIVQVKRYYYNRTHYFDNIALNDDRMLRTPFFLSKITRYIDEIVPQHPDTIAKESIRIIEMARRNKESFRFLVQHFYNKANNSKIMGMDAVLVAIAEKYYLSGEADWAEEKFINDLRESINSIKYTLIGRKAVDLSMVSVTGEWFKLSEVDAPYTILIFWEPSCGHCKDEIPLLKKEVWDKYAKDGVKIFAVYCQVERKEWEEFIAEHQLEEWMNVYDPYGRSGFRKYYNIKSTPQIFILDKDKNIIAKRIGADQIGGFLDFMMKGDK